MDEVREIQMYEAILKDIRRCNPNNQKDEEEILEIVEVEYRLGRISDQQVRYLTRLLIKNGQ